MTAQPAAPQSPNQSPSAQPPKAPRRSLFSARKFALMASAVAIIGASAYTLAPSVSHYDLLTTPAQAQVDSAVKNLQRPTGFADIVAQVKPSVISVRVKIDRDDDGAEALPFPPGSPMERFFRRFGGPDGMPGMRGGRRGHSIVTGQGSGFFISADGYAVTNNHVVDGASEVDVRTDDGKTYTAKVIGTDPRTDIALIKIDGGSTSFPFAKLSDSNPRIGDWVLAVGNPFGLGGTVTAGIVSASGRDIGSGPYDDFIQIDAPINKGNSGGPSFNIDGEVMGVNTAIYSPSGGNVGIAFSIPASTVKQVVAQLKDKGSVSRGWIGVQIQPVTKDIADSLGLSKAEGALVAEPQRGSPADKAGIESGDVITAVNGEAIKDARVLARKIGSLAPGEKVKLTTLRKGQEKTVELTLGELPKQREARNGRGGDDRGERRRGDRDAVPRLGLSLAPAASVAGAGDNGVVVIDVDPDSPAAERGFKEGDVILDVGGKEVSSVKDVRDAVADARKESKNTVLLRVRSGDTSRFVALPLGRG
ncbi:MAG: Do family serine endopeptidase [Xanthobacteraceae bacterium]